MTEQQAVAIAINYARTLGIADIKFHSARRFPTWWVVAFDDYNLPFAIVEDTGATHVEVEPFGQWFGDN